MSEKVTFKMEVDDSELERDLNKSSSAVEKSAEETARKQKKASDDIAENAKKNNKKIAESAEKAYSDIEKSVKETNDKIVSDTDKASENVEKIFHDTADEIVGQHKKASEEMQKHDKEYEEKALKTASNVAKGYAAAAAAIAAGTTAAVKTAMNDQTSYAKVGTLLENGTNEKRYAADIRAASKDTGVNIGDYSEAVYESISASVNQNSAVDFTETSVKLAKGGFTEASTAVNILTTAINAYGKEISEASHISDVLITTQNLGKTTVNELAASMGQTIPIANNAGTSLEDLSTQYAILTKNGVATSESGTQIKAMLDELNSSSSNVSETLKELTGSSFSELQASGKNTADVLNILSEHASNSGQKLSDLFGSMEAGSAALTIVKDGGKDFNNILNQMQNSAGATQAAYEKMTSTVDAKLSKLGNSFMVTFSEAGEKALPVIDEFIQYVDNNSDEIETIILDIGEAMKTVIIITGDLTKTVWENKEAVVAVAAAFVSYKTAVAISSVINQFTKATEGATIAQKALNLAMSANPAGLVAAGVATLVTGLAVVSNELSKVGETGQKAVEKSAELIDEVKELNDETERTKENVSSLQDIADEYENIVNSTMNASQKKEELSSVQEQLNALYEDEARNIDLVNGKYDENLEKLQVLSDSKRGYMTAMAKEALDKSEEAMLQASNWQTMSFSDANSQWRFNYEGVGENAVRDMENILKNAAKNHGISDDDYAHGVTTSSLAGTGDILANFDNIKNIDEQIQLLEEILEGMRDKNLTDEFSENYIKLYELLEQKQNAVHANLEAEEYYNSLLNEITKSTVDETAATNENTSAIWNQVNAANAAAYAKAENKTTIDELNNSTKAIISEYEKLGSIVSVVNSGDAITYDQLQMLLGIYPELADNVSVTTEGYIIEASALDSLNNALMDGVNAQLEAEREKTQAAIDGAETRIQLYQREAVAFAQVNDSKKVKEISAAITAEQEYINELKKKLKVDDTVSEYVKGISAGATSTIKNNGSNTSATVPDEYIEKRKTLDYSRSMGYINDETYYKQLGGLRDRYLEADSDAWRSVNVDIHNWEESLKNKKEVSTANRSSSQHTSGNIISIDSYIPTLWDDEEETNKKLQRALGIELSGNSKYGHIIKSIETASEASTKIGASSSAVVDAKAPETTLSDVINAIKSLEKADEKRKISLDIDLYARDLMIGKIAVADINDMTRMNGKSPLVKK